MKARAGDSGFWKSADFYLALAVLVIAIVTVWTTYFVCHGFFMAPDEPK